VYQRFFFLEKWIKVRTNFFLFDSEFDSEQAFGVMFNLRPPVKMVNFRCDVTFISVFDGIRDIFLKTSIYLSVLSTTNGNSGTCIAKSLAQKLSQVLFQL
jgi:hypothetical protein